MEAARADRAQKTEGAQPCLVARPDRAKSLVQVYKAALLLRRRPVLGPQPAPNSVFGPGRSGPGPMHTPSYETSYQHTLWQSR